jgi:glycosyltransferase involved in cell wall biosynthesis
MHVVGGYNLGGISVGVDTLVRHGFYDGFDFRFVALAQGERPIRDNFGCLLGDRAFFLMDHKSPDIWKYGHSYLLKLNEHFRDFRPDAVILSNTNSLIVGRTLAIAYANTTVITFDHGATLKNKPWRNRLVRYTSIRNDMTFADSVETGSQAQRKYHLKQTPCYIVPLVVVKPETVRLCEQPAHFKILSLGRLDPIKNYPELIHACALLAQKGYSFDLTIAGEGSQRAELEKLVIDLNVKNCVFLPGHAYDPEHLRKAAHIYIQPSLSEGLCLSVVEAMAEGMVTVATNVGGMLDYGIDGENMIKINGFERNSIMVGLMRAMTVYGSQGVSLSSHAISTVDRLFNIGAIKVEWEKARAAMVQAVESRPGRRELFAGHIFDRFDRV